MPAYVISQFSIHDTAGYKEYEKLAEAALARYIGRTLAATNDVIDCDGVTAPHGQDTRVIIVEFETLQAAKRWYESSENQAAEQVRKSSASGRVFIVDGFW